MRIGAPDPTLTSVAGMITVTELCDRLDVIGRLNAAIGPLKQRRRGHTAGEVLVGIAAAQRFSDGQWAAVETGLGDVHAVACSAWRRWRRRGRPRCASR